MPLPLLPFGTLISSKQLISGNHINGFNNLLTGTATNLVATAAGTAATSLQLNSAFNEIATVANANDSVTLPPAKSGLRVMITNNGANTLKIWANGTDVIGGGAGAASVTINGAGNLASLFVAVKDGVWRQIAVA
jgi:hypothetical protein